MENQPKITLSSIDPFGISLYFSERDFEITAFNLACIFCSRNDYTSWRLNTYAIYLLRGTSTDKKDILFALLEVPELPEPLRELLNYLQFYNQHGKEIFKTAALTGENYRDCTLRQLEQDCDVVIKSAEDKYTSGAGQNHIWIAEQFSGKRILLIHF